MDIRCLGTIFCDQFANLPMELYGTFGSPELSARLVNFRFYELDSSLYKFWTKDIFFVNHWSTSCSHYVAPTTSLLMSFKANVSYFKLYQFQTSSRNSTIVIALICTCTATCMYCLYPLCKSLAMAGTSRCFMPNIYCA